MVDSPKNGRALGACLLIAIVAATSTMVSRYVILDVVVDPGQGVVASVLVAICINLVSFGASGMARKHYTGKAFGSTKDFGLKFLIAMGTAVVFSIGTSMALGQFLAGDNQLLVWIDGRQYMDMDVAFRHVIAWAMLYLLIAAISYAFTRGG